MSISERLQKAKEISIWVHSKTNGISIPRRKKIVMGAALLQHILDLTDAIIILLEHNLPGPALVLARPMHEGYVRSVWLLEHASDESVKKFELGICPRLPELLKQIGEEPESSGAFIKGMSDLNLSSFHDLTHGGIEHIIRRMTDAAVEPTYSSDEIERFI